MIEINIPEDTWIVKHSAEDWVRFMKEIKEILPVKIEHFEYDWIEEMVPPKCRKKRWCAMPRYVQGYIAKDGDVIRVFVEGTNNPDWFFDIIIENGVVRGEGTWYPEDLKRFLELLFNPEEIVNEICEWRPTYRMYRYSLCNKR